MKRFTCPNCSNEVHFESSRCVVCGQALGMETRTMEMISVGAPAPDGTALNRCVNAVGAGCNWMARSGSNYCIACAHNRTVPSLSAPGNRESWAVLELAKRKLIYTLQAWGLAHPTRAEDPQNGLAFDFLAEVQKPDGSTELVKTGHQNGIITLNLAEGDEAERVERKQDLNEPYRTAIGHLRHEIAHFYWMRIVDGTPHLDLFRDIFGDDRQDYAAALGRHYQTGAPAGWQQSHISAYATSHPWEDFAETWAHWMHIVDGIETARSYGLRPSSDTQRDAPGAIYTTTDVAHVVDQWVPLTVAINSLNRGMGQPDLYPFVLSKPVVRKMAFINDVIHAAARSQAA